MPINDPNKICQNGNLGSYFCRSSFNLPLSFFSTISPQEVVRKLVLNCLAKATEIGETSQNYELLSFSCSYSNCQGALGYIVNESDI